MPPFRLDEFGNVVTEQGTIPAFVAQRLGFGASADLVVPAEISPELDPELDPEPPPAPVPNATALALPEVAPGPAAAPMVSALPEPATLPPLDSAPLLQMAPDELSPTSPRAVARDIGTLGGLNKQLAQNAGEVRTARQAAEESNYQANLRDGDAALDAELRSLTADNESLGTAIEARKELRATMDDIDARAERLREQLDNFEIDPNRVFRKQSTVANVADILAVGFGAMAEFSTGRNAAMELVRKKVEDDMAAQKDRRDQVFAQYKHLPQELQAARSVYDNVVAADEVERAIKYKAVEHMFKARIAQTSNLRARAALEKGRAEAEQEYLSNLEKARQSTTSIALESMRQRFELRKAAARDGGPTVQAPVGKYVLKNKATGEVQDAVVPLEHMGEATRKRVIEGASAVPAIYRVANNLAELNLEVELRGENKARVAQQAAAAVAHAIRTLPGVASEGDADREAKAMGLPSSDLNGIRTFLMGAGGKDVVNRIKISGEEKKQELLQTINQFAPPGTEYEWEGIEAPANPLLKGVLDAETQDPDAYIVKEEQDALSEAAYGLPGGASIALDAGLAKRKGAQFGGFLNVYESKLRKGLLSIDQRTLSPEARFRGEDANTLRKTRQKYNTKLKELDELRDFISDPAQSAAGKELRGRLK